MQTIDYEKYSNMSERQLVNARIKEIKLNAELQKKLENSSDLITFLETKINEIWKSQKRENYNFISYENSSFHKKAKDIEKTLSDADKAEIRAEIEADINKDYGDELRNNH
ncbi:MAG: hypothetical protein LUC16_01255 [Coprobacillus sp.]|nr:hypothetical protein [Coprobacillus sp.]